MGLRGELVGWVERASRMFPTCELIMAELGNTRVLRETHHLTDNHSDDGYRCAQPILQIPASGTGSAPIVALTMSGARSTVPKASESAPFLQSHVPPTRIL